MTIDEKALFREALKARKNAYCPYSGFAVGAALLTASGEIFHGCNIENAAFGPTICAERCAIFTAVAQGFQTFTAIAIVGGPSEKADLTLAYPCGVCRQVMREFCTPERFQIIVGTDEAHLTSYTLEDLLPHSFSL